MDMNLGIADSEAQQALKISDDDGTKLQSTKDLTVNLNDVLCGRGKTSFNHVGNRRFRDMISASIEEYNEAESRMGKSKVVGAIVNDIKFTGGRFLKKDGDSGNWIELDDRQAKEKVGHAIRDAAWSVESRKKKRKMSKSGTFTVDPEGQEDASKGTARNSDNYQYLEGGDDFFLSDDEYKNVQSKKRFSWSSTGSASLSAAKYNDNYIESNIANDNESEGDHFLQKINDVLGPMPAAGIQQDPLPTLLNWQNLDHGNLTNSLSQSSLSQAQQHMKLQPQSQLQFQSQLQSQFQSQPQPQPQLQSQLQLQSQPQSQSQSQSQSQLQEDSQFQSRK